MFVLGVLMFLVGLDLLVWPQTFIVLHFTNDALGLNAHHEPEFVSTTASRIYGILTTIGGVVLAIFSLYHEKK
jgi:hypothetical protein